VEKCKITPKVNPGLLIGRVAVGLRDFPITDNFSVPIKDRNLIITECRLCTERRPFDYEISFELLDESGELQKDAYSMTINTNEIPEFFQRIKPG
jgi:hypothetical protein